MNKTEMINVIAEESGLSKQDSKKALDAVVKTITDALIAGEKLKFVGFGTFSVVQRASRKCMDLSTKQLIDVKAKKVVKFRPGADLSLAVDN